MKRGTLESAIWACIANGRRLLEDAELLRDFEKYPTALAVAVLAEEEFAKSFVLVLVSDGTIPWTCEVRRSISIHECKHLVGVVIEWLGPHWEEQYRRLQASLQRPAMDCLPYDVAVAINILRHEKIERMRLGYTSRDPEDDGLSRSIAEGLRDRAKQRAVYVSVSKTGVPASVPDRVTSEEATAELARAKQYGDFAEEAAEGRVLSFVEYRFFKDVVREVFADLALDSVS